MSLAPEPPPTAGASTRTRWGGRSSSSQMNWRTWCGACVDAHTVSSPAIALYSATSPRVSMGWPPARPIDRSEEHTSEFQSRLHLVCRLLLEKKKKKEHTRVV